MQRRFANLILAGTLIATPSFAGTIYTREDAVRIALEKSSDIKTAEQNMKSAESKVSGAYGNAYPSIDFSATYARTFGVSDVRKSTAISDMLHDVDDQNADINDKILGSVLDNYAYALSAMGNGYRWGTQVGLTATQILYAQGKVATGVEIAKAYKRVNELALDQTKSDVRYNIETAFDQVLYLDSAVAIYEASIAQATDHLEYVKQAHEAGLVGELDMVRAQLQVDELTSGLEKTKKNQVIAKNALLNTMGLPWEEGVDFTGTLRSPDDGSVRFPDTSMNGIRQRRKELAQLRESSSMYKKNVDIEEGDYRPTVVLGGSITYQNGQNRVFKWDAPDWDDNINKKVYLNISMNLFNGLQTREKVVQAKSDLRKNQIQQETAERGIQLELESAVNTWNDAQKQMDIQKRKVDLAQRTLELTQVSYEAGKSPQLDLLDANMSLRNAKLDYMSALVDWNKAYDALLKATGEY
ncbi:MAG: TolC family protein [Fibrobacteraceae bacterium]|nr:TolC family protein [Fibrobacteraceae bacterium]